MWAGRETGHDVSMTQQSPRAAIALVALAVAALALAGCAPATTAGATAGATHAPVKHTPVKHVAPALDTTAPAAQISTPCSSLVTPAEITAWQGSGVTAVAPAALAAGDLADASIQVPAADYIREAGGLVCLWSAGPVDEYLQGNGTVPSFLEITVQFGAGAEYALNAPGLGAENGRAGECDVDDPGSICQNDDLLGNGTWVEILSRHAVGTGTGGDDIGTIETSVLAAVTAAGSPTGSTAPESGTTALGTQCTDFASTTDIQSAVGSAVTASTPDQGQTGTDPQTPIWYPSQDVLKDHPCVFSTGSAVQARLAWIPGGAWAWAENKTQALADAPLQSLHLTGLGANDSASIRCAPGDAACVVDLVVGGNWIEAAVPASSTAANKRTAATAVAQAIVTHLA
jgi:hypothetical protein